MDAPQPLSRRTFVAGSGLAAVYLGTGTFPSDAVPWRTVSKPTSYPFSLGVASGDPLPNSVVLWTRLAPEPLAPDGLGGMDHRPVRVEWEVATDDGFRHVARRGTVTATPELAHSVHPEVWGLEPGRDYWYRFRALGEVSQVGHTRTAPAYGSRLDRLAFAFASCARWDQGYYTAYRHLAEEDVDVVFHLGDYIYEYGIDGNGGDRKVATSAYLATEATDLARYRLQYGLYKSDPDLIRAHLAHPFVVTPDDHEVENNWAGLYPEEGSQSKGARWLPRRAAAFRAYYEHLPLRASALPVGPDMRVYRSLAYGDLVEFDVLDTRQFRDDQAYGDGSHPASPELSPDMYDPRRTMMGLRQEAWLQHRFARSSTRWHVLANHAPMAATDIDPGPGKTLYTDPWDGYIANRNRVLGGARAAGVENLVVITGDRHQNYASNLLLDYDDPGSPVVGTEFVGTSITSGGNGSDMTAGGRTVLEANDHVKFFNNQRGYVRVRLDRDQWASDFRVIPYVDRPGAPVSTRATWAVESGRPGVQLATQTPAALRPGVGYTDDPMPPA